MFTKKLNVFFATFLLSSLIIDVNCVLWPCVTSSDCNLVAGATCSSFNICICPAGYVFSESVSECLKESLYGETCVDSNQCSHMLYGSKCNSVCQCAEGLTYIKGRCKKLANLYDSCEDVSDCSFGYDRESVICEEKRCACAQGFYQRNENICRRKSMNIGDPCIVHEDCQNDQNICVNFECTTKTTKDVGMQTIEKLRETKTTSIDIFHTHNNNRTLGKIFGDKCDTNNEPCPNLLHSICIQNLCHCKAGYYVSDGICNAEVGEYAETEALCKGAFTHFIAESKKCACDKNYFANNNLRSCVKPVAAINFACTEQSQCSPFGASFCPGLDVFPRRCACHSYANYNEESQQCVPKIGLGSFCEPNIDDCNKKVENAVCSSNQCVCKSNYVDINGQCKSGENAKCSEDSDCAVQNSQCRVQNETAAEKVCLCKSGFQYAKEQCLKEATEYNESCEETEQCTPLLGNLSKCSDKKCICEDHLQYNKGKCNPKKALGESCTKSVECFVTSEPENVECRNSVCECKFGTVKDLEQQVCRPLAKKSSSDRPSVLKVITLMLTTAALLITTAAIKEAYY